MSISTAVGGGRERHVIFEIGLLLLFEGSKPFLPIFFNIKAGICWWNGGRTDNWILLISSLRRLGRFSSR